MAAAKTVLTADSIVRVLYRKWHLIVLGVLVAMFILMEALRLSGEQGVEENFPLGNRPTRDMDAQCEGASEGKAYINCHPDQEPSPLTCMQRGCCWLPDESNGAPPCVLPAGATRYVMASSAKTMDSWSANLTLLKNASALPMTESTTITVTCIAFAHEFARLRIHDAKEKEFETPVPPVPQDDGATYISYDFTYHGKFLTVSPNSFPRYNLRFLLGKMFHADGLKQLPVKLPGEIVYGLRGPRRVPFANFSQWSNHTFFTSHGQQRSSGVYESVHPFFVMAKRRISLGLFLRTSNDVELTLSPNRVATFRVSGGVLDFFIFFGATPTEVVAQYTRFVGLPAMPSLRFIENGTPTSTDRIVLPFSMPVKEESGPKLEQRLLDLTHPAAEHEWTKMMDTLQAFENLRTTDVMWLEAVSCLNGTSEALECPEDSRTFPCNECSGTPKLHLSQYSDVRNAYGYLMARMAHRVMAPKLGAYPALATSNDTFPGIGKWNVLWNLAPGQGVKGLKRAVRDIQLYSILGLPYFIMSLCPVEAVSNNTALPPVPLSSGSCIKTTNLSLWLSLAAFLPIMQHLNTSTRLDGGQTEKEETSLKGRYVTAVRDAQSLRSKFLPHLYTLIFKCSTTGDMIVRPLSFEFPGEPQAPSHSTQFMLGPHLMVVPQTQHQASHNASTPTPVYVPRGVWYEWFRWRRMESRGTVFFVPSTNTSHPRLFVRGGGIVVTRYKSRGLNRKRNTMSEANTTFLELTVCLDGTGSAEGELITAPPDKEAPYATLSERNTRFRFFYARNFLAGYCSPCVHGDVLGSVTILGLTKAPSRVEFNGEELAFSIDKQALMVESAYHVLTKPFVMKLI